MPRAAATGRDSASSRPDERTGVAYALGSCLSAGGFAAIDLGRDAGEALARIGLAVAPTAPAFIRRWCPAGA